VIFGNSLIVQPQSHTPHFSEKVRGVGLPPPAVIEKNTDEYTAVGVSPAFGSPVASVLLLKKILYFFVWVEPDIINFLRKNFNQGRIKHYPPQEMRL